MSSLNNNIYSQIPNGDSLSGVFESIPSQYNSVSINIRTDQNVTLLVQFSDNASSVVYEKSYAVTPNYYHQRVHKYANYFKITATNSSGSDTTTFQLRVNYSTGDIGDEDTSSIVSINNKIHTTTDLSDNVHINVFDSGNSALISQVVSETEACKNELQGFKTKDHVTAWNAQAVINGSETSVVDCQFDIKFDIYGNSDAAIDLELYISSDNVTFYKSSQYEMTVDGDFHFSVSNFCFRYFKIKSLGSANISLVISKI